MLPAAFMCRENYTPEKGEVEEGTPLCTMLLPQSGDDFSYSHLRRRRRPESESTFPTNEYIVKARVVVVNTKYVTRGAATKIGQNFAGTDLGQERRRLCPFSRKRRGVPRERPYESVCFVKSGLKVQHRSSNRRGSTASRQDDDPIVDGRHRSPRVGFERAEQPLLCGPPDDGV